jgi:hypothetical protein
MFKICEHKLTEQGGVATTEVPRCVFEKRNDAVSYMNMLTQVLRPNAGYESDKDCWWVRNNDGVTRFTILA